MTAPLLGWYDAGHRDLPWRASPTPYHVWVSEIMLQQTRVEAVRGYYDRWMQALPDIRALAAAEEAVYMKLWEGLGYYSRVRNLHRAAVEVCETYDGALPADYDKLRALPGIGEYTAGAIASIAFGLPVPAVDGNVLRVAARLDNDFTPITDVKYKKQTRTRFAALMPADRPGDLNQALMELGAMVCLPNGAPLCGDCPVQHLCLGYHHGNAAALPMRAAKKARRVEQRTVLLIRCGAGRHPPPAGQRPARRSVGIACAGRRADAGRGAAGACGARLADQQAALPAPGQAYFHPCGMAHDRLLS